MPYRSPNQRAVTPQHRGRFPGYDVLDEVDRWDDVTAGVVLARLAPTTDLSFFTKAENAVANPLCDLLLGQDGDPRVPVVALVDGRLAMGETDGWHYDDLPEDGQAWRDTLRFLDEDATALAGEPFSRLSREQQAQLVQSVQDRSQDSADWHGYPAKQVWSLWTRYVCAAFYAHPWAWNEIGFGGPAYPRGYKNRHVGGRERWEVADHDDTDPVPFAGRVERARHNHERLVSDAEAGS
jgi:hypothetical protein